MCCPHPACAAEFRWWLFGGGGGCPLVCVTPPLLYGRFALVRLCLLLGLGNVLFDSRVFSFCGLRQTDRLTKLCNLCRASPVQARAALSLSVVRLSSYFLRHFFASDACFCLLSCFFRLKARGRREGVPWCGGPGSRLRPQRTSGHPVQPGAGAAAAARSSFYRLGRLQVRRRGGLHSLTHVANPCCWRWWWCCCCWSCCRQSVLLLLSKCCNHVHSCAYCRVSGGAATPNTVLFLTNKTVKQGRRCKVALILSRMRACCMNL